MQLVKYLFPFSMSIHSILKSYKSCQSRGSTTRKNPVRDFKPSAFSKIYKILRQDFKISELKYYVTYGVKHLVSGDIQKILQVKISESKINRSHVRTTGIAHEMLNMQKYMLSRHSNIRDF